MAVNKLQIGLISMINAISAIYAWFAIHKYGWLYDSLADPYQLVYISIITMNVAASIIAIYFFLMCCHNIICSCLTGDDNNKGPGFSFCGCIINLLLFGSFVLGWFVYLIKCINCESYWLDNYKELWNAYIILLANPIIILFLVLLFWIYKICFNKKEKNDLYIRHRNNDELV
jgi:hypothetical protein